MKILILLSLLTLIIGHTVYALESADYADMAKNRTYIGGAEESDLKLLPETYFQKNKTTRSEEVNEGF